MNQGSPSTLGITIGDQLSKTTGMANDADTNNDNFADVIQSHLKDLCKLIVAEHDRSVARRVAHVLEQIDKHRAQSVDRPSNNTDTTSPASSECQQNLAPSTKKTPAAASATRTPQRHSINHLIRTSGWTATPKSELEPTDAALQKGQQKSTIESLVQIVKDSAEVARFNSMEVKRTKTMKRIKGRLFNFSETKVDSVMGAIILLNIFCIGLSTDVGRGSLVWFVIDTMFAICFAWEMCFKITRMGARQYFRGSSWAWNILDTTICGMAMLEVVMAVIQLSSDKSAQKSRLSIFRIIRLCRITRLIRLIRIPLFKDLLMMVNGMIGGMRTLFWSIVLILCPLYALALFMRETIGEEAGPTAEPFSSLRKSMFSVFRCVVSGDCSDSSGRPMFVLITQEFGWHNAAIYCLTMLLMTFGLFNVIIALYVENTVAAAKHNDVLQRRTRLQDQQRLALKTNELVQAFWAHYLKKQKGEEYEYNKGRTSFLITEAANIEITLDLFEDVIKDEKVQEILSDLDIPEEDRVDLFDILDADGNRSVILEELVMGITKLRGESRRSDIISVGLQVRELQIAIHHLETAQTKMINDLLEKIEFNRTFSGTHHRRETNELEFEGTQVSQESLAAI